MELLGETLTVKRKVKLWSGDFEFEFLPEGNFVIVSVLRASLPMTEGMLEVLKGALAGFIGVKRDEKTLKAKIYYKRLPPLRGKVVIIPDPMLATGSTMELILPEILKEPPAAVKTVHCVVAPEGLKLISETFPTVEVYTVAEDERLNEKSFIIPGLGDAGDRAFNTY